jgi:recombination protein RecT
MNIQTQNLPAVIAAVEARKSQIVALLPADVSVETFMSHFKVAVMKTAGLLECTPKSVVLACIQAANDGLLPDGREAAIIVYNKKQRDGSWVREASYQQMYLGILKRIRQAAEVAKIEARVVYAEDHFDYSYGDEAFIEHKPYYGTQDKGSIIAAYAICHFKDGQRQHEVMDAREILSIRDRSKSFDPNKPGSSPWHTDFGEMAKKTVLKRLGKILPQARGRAVISADADDSGAEEEIDIYPELGVPEAQRVVETQVEPKPAAPAQADSADPTSRQEVPETLPPKIFDNEADEVAFWKTHLRQLRDMQRASSDIESSEDAYNEWSAQFEEIPAEVEAEVAKIVKRRVDQLKSEAARKEPSDYAKMQEEIAAGTGDYEKLKDGE